MRWKSIWKLALPLNGGALGEAARWAKCGVKLIYREVTAKRLKAARVGGRRDIRMKPEWIDAWLEAAATA